jgi:HSP20 family protein
MSSFTLHPELRNRVYPDAGNFLGCYSMGLVSHPLIPRQLLLSAVTRVGGSSDGYQVGKGPIPVPYEEFENFPKHVEEFFDLIARRPFELLEKSPLLLGRELEYFGKSEPELLRPIYLKMYETEENLVVRAEVPGFSEKELNIACEPWRLIITARKEYQEEAKIEKKEEIPEHMAKMQLYKAIQFLVEVRLEKVKATLKHGMLEVTLPKAEVVKKVKIEVKTL